MLDINDFSKKQIAIFMPVNGDRISYQNDNMIIKDSDGKVKYQHTCYRLFALIIIGDCSITTGIIRRAKKFGFSICFMSYSFRYYAILNNGMEGNNYLHAKQYSYGEMNLGQHIILNKVVNQRSVLSKIRRKSELLKEGITILDGYINRLQNEKIEEREVLLSIEGNAARVYFSRIFDNVNWRGRKPRIKFDYVNSLLDIGYSLLFNYIECILRVFDFDVYHGVLHTDFYMRKSLVCDLMEVFRPLIDWKVRKCINLGQFKKEDFVEIKNQWHLDYKKNAEYTSIFIQELLDNKESIFLYIRGYYRAFMKGKEAKEFPMFNILSKEIVLLED